MMKDSSQNLVQIQVESRIRFTAVMEYSATCNSFSPSYLYEIAEY